ncbi:hypothetical protein Bca4012_031141 [Brassica carinata]
MYEEFTAVPDHSCNGLFLTGEDGFRTRRMTSISIYLEDIKNLKESFHSSTIIHVPRTQNIMADQLARSARNQLSYVVHMHAEPLVWLTESI